MSIEGESLKTLVHGIEALAELVLPHHGEKIKKTGKSTRKQIDSIQDIITLSKELTSTIPQYINNLISDPKKNEKVAEKFEDTANKVYQEGTKVLKRTDKTLREIAPSLHSLLDAIKAALVALKNFFAPHLAQAKNMVTGLQTLKNKKTEAHKKTTAVQPKKSQKKR